jgi:hypothetical protein
MNRGLKSIVHRIKDPAQLKELEGKLVFCKDPTDNSSLILYKGVSDCGGVDCHKIATRTIDSDTIIVNLIPVDKIRVYDGRLKWKNSDSIGGRELIYHREDSEYNLLDNELKGLGI